MHEITLFLLFFPQPSRKILKTWQKRRSMLPFALRQDERKNIGNILSTDYILLFAVCCWTISIWQVWFNHVIQLDAEIPKGFEVLLNRHIKCFLTLHNIFCLKTVIHKDGVRKNCFRYAQTMSKKDFFKKLRDFSEFIIFFLAFFILCAIFIYVCY